MSWPVDRDKLDRFRRLMAEQDLDAVVVRAPDNIVYLDSYWCMKGYDALVMPAEGEPVLVVLEPQDVETSLLMMRGTGRSLYRMAQVTGRFDWKRGQQLFLTYTRGRAQGTLNDFSGVVGNFPAPLVRHTVYSNLPGDVPNHR